MTSYLSGTYGRKARIAMGVAALILIPVHFLPVLPVWSIFLRAPQYNEGLRMQIYANTVKGNLQQINTLNHYVGMKAISPDDFREFRWMPLLLTALGVWAGLGALWGRRWFAIAGWILFSLAALALLADFATWLYRYGHDLDPRAPLKMGAFTPPLIGYRKMGNFHVASWPGLGGALLLLAGALGPVIALLEWRNARRHRA
jgi:copper chaperone NosL